MHYVDVAIPQRKQRSHLMFKPYNILSRRKPWKLHDRHFHYIGHKANGQLYAIIVKLVIEPKPFPADMIFDPGRLSALALSTG